MDELTLKVNRKKLRMILDSLIFTATVDVSLDYDAAESIANLNLAKELRAQIVGTDLIMKDTKLTHTSEQYSDMVLEDEHMKEITLELLKG